MADAASVRTGRRLVRIAQGLLLLGALALWVASRLPWVTIRTFDGLGQPKTTTLNGATWSTALLPLALLLLAAAAAGLAVRGWPMRVLALLAAAASVTAGYLAVSQWVIPDVAVRAADLAGVPVMFLVGSERRYGGAALALLGAVCTLAAAVLLIRSATAGRATTSKYAAPAARRSAVRSEQIHLTEGDRAATNPVSERTLWDALDEGKDPTDEPPPSGPVPDTEGR